MAFTTQQILLGRKKLRRKRWAGHVVRMWELVNMCMVLVRDYVGKGKYGSLGKFVFVQMIRNTFCINTADKYVMLLHSV
jgi:hypothetical protein